MCGSWSEERLHQHQNIFNNLDEFTKGVIMIGTVQFIGDWYLNELLICIGNGFDLDWVQLIFVVHDPLLLIIFRQPAPRNFHQLVMTSLNSYCQLAIYCKLVCRKYTSVICAFQLQSSFFMTHDTFLENFILFWK